MSRKFITNTLLIFFVLFSLIKNDDIETITYDFINGYGEITKNNAIKKQSFTVDFSNQQTNIPYYIKALVTSKDDNPAPLLCFSNSDQNCNTRDQLVKNPNDKIVFLWIKREQFEKSDQSFFIMVQCENDGCAYNLRVEGAQAAIFEPNFIYSYLVTTYNKEMKFEIDGTEKNVYITVSLDGSSKATLEVENIYESIEKYKTGKTVTFFLEDYEINTSNLAIITVKGGEVGEYLTLSVHSVNTLAQYEGVAENGLILPNGGEITGFLEPDKFKKECFPIDLSDSKYSDMRNFYITGRIHTKYARFYLEDENMDYLEETNTDITDGLLAFVMKNNGKMNYMCFEIPDENIFKIKKMIFSFSITEPNSISDLYSFYPPQLTGEIYRRIIPKGKIVFFSGTKNDNTALKYDYSLYQRKGVTKMYIGDCRTYPNCIYTKEGLDNLYDPKNINQMSIWTATIDKSSAIGTEKFVIVAQCLDDDNENNGYCEFETSIFSKGQDITLVENEKFSKFVVNEEKGSFIADFHESIIIQRITFDIMIFSGDVSFTVKDDTYQNYVKYYLSNKIFIHFTLGQSTIEKIIIDYTAQLNSFFTIQYGMHTYNADQASEIIPSGESYLMQIDPTYSSRTKYIYLSNFFYKYKNEYLANFFEINCEFEVKRGDETINFFDGYAQDIIDTSFKEYNKPYYFYTVKITEPDLSNYNHKMCMLYVAGFETENNYDREIVVGENINQQIIFKENFKKVRFLYPLSDITKDIVVNVNVIDKAFYKIIIFSKYYNVREEIITNSQKLYIKGSIAGRYCDEDTVCPVVVQVEFQSQIVKTDPMIEITIREIKNTPSYLQKGQAKLDFVCGDKFYYLYTDIGKNELGEITINFLREFGNLWAKVVRKDQSNADDNANWRGIYRMPSEDWSDSLSFNSYTKKLFVSSEDTADCIEGCYLLISVQISQIGEYVQDYKFYPFSIITRITPSSKAYTDVPKVVIQVDEFIIGNVDLAENDKIYEFFEIWLPHDSEIVLFDWQSSVAGLYINLGGIRPTTKIADFKLLPPGKDYILNLTKNEILDKAAIKKINIPYENSIQDINLVIGVWTDKTDSIDTEIYSLKVHLPDEDVNSNLDIYEVNTDQKILCNPTRIEEDQYRCLFVVTYDNEDVNMLTPILAYGGSLNNGALTYMYANFIDRKIYDEYSRNDLISNIPTFQTATINTKLEGVDYIYKSDLLKDKYMFINVMADKPDPIMMVTSMPIYNYISHDLKEFYPNPSTEQLLYVYDDRLRLSFPCTESITVNIDTLNGHAELSWKNDPNTIFALRGMGDRISLSSGKEIDQLIIHKLSDSNTNSNNQNLNSMENPGFAFYISYFIKDNNIKFNEITYGKSLEITYKDSDLPVILYSKIGSEYYDINIAITFKDNQIDNGGIHATSPLKVSALLVKESLIYEAKKDSDLRPSEKEINGYYDPALKTAQVFLSEDIIKNFNIKKEDNPTLYIRIDKNEDGIFADKTFEKFSIEAQVSGVNDGVIPVEKVYHYGRVRNTALQQTVYRLKTDKNRPIMRVQIAFNSNNLDFVVSDSETKRSNITFLNNEKNRGKVYVTLQINDNQELYYLIIYKKSKTTTEEHLNNYAFKYINARYEYELFDYPILNSPEISVSESTEDSQDVISCTFNRLDIDKGKANITYFFKVVENSTYYYGEEINTIAVTESPYYTVYERNPEYKDKITLTAKGNLKNWVYLNIIAQVQQNNILEYIAYNGKVFLRPNGNEESKNSNVALFIGVGCGLLVVVIGLVITIFIIKRRNKELLNKVKHVSFQKGQNNMDPNLLLKKSEKDSE